VRVAAQKEQYNSITCVVQAICWCIWFCHAILWLGRLSSCTLLCRQLIKSTVDGMCCSQPPAICCPPTHTPSLPRADMKDLVQEAASFYSFAQDRPACVLKCPTYPTRFLFSGRT